MNFVGCLSLFSSILFYDPFFLKDYSIDFLSDRKANLTLNKDSYILLSEVPVSKRLSLSFIPALKTNFVRSKGSCYINNYLELEFNGGVKVDSFELAASVDFFNFSEPLRVPYYSPLSDNQYNQYSFDIQPIIGKTSILDINIRNAYIKYKSNNFDLLVGRSEVRIGEGMLFSGISYPIDHIYNLNFRFKNFHLTSAFAAVPDTFLTRTLAYQAVEWKPVPSLTFTVYEAVSHSQEDYFKYFNPLSLYYERQRRSSSNSDNLLGGFAIKWNFLNKYSAFLDFLNDDVVIFQGNTSKYGILAGFESALSSNSLIRFHAVAIPRFTYTHVSDTNAWHTLGVPFGYPRGSDLLDFYLTYTLFLEGNDGIIFRIAQLNKGDGTLTEHYEGSGFPGNMPYPTGRVLRELFIMGGIQRRFLYSGVFADLQYRSKNHLYGFFLFIRSRLFSLKF